MKRKMLISIALVMIMLLNCMMPLFVVTAAEGEGIQLNSKLYSAVKASLLEQSIPFTCNDITHTLTLTEENKSKVTALYLNENAIADLTGLDYFSSVTRLELSGNNLTKDSNLGVLNSLPLSYLDLSTNQLEDVSSIDTVIKSIEDANGTVVLSGQTVTIVHEAIIDENEESNQEVTASFQLPLILEKAGFVKSAWIKQSGIPESVYGTYAPGLEEMTNPISADSNEIKIRIASDNGLAYKGLYKLEIYIYDDQTEASSAANLNPAATNILNGSRFYIYVVVHGSKDAAVFTPDSNLYKAIKSQLTHGQTENAELESYPYQVNADGLTITNKYFFEVDRRNEGWLILTNVANGEREFFYNPKSGELHTYSINGEISDVVNLPVTEIVIREFNEDGIVTVERKGYEIPLGNFDGTLEYDPVKGEYVSKIGKDLYVKAYDDAKVFIIEKGVLVNKITSLILNNKEIRDLSGLEKFVGLESYLNVSHNYLSDINPIYKLQEEKIAYEKELQEEYNYWLKDREYGNLTKSLTNAKNYKEQADAEMKNIGEAVKGIMEAIVEASKIENQSQDDANQEGSNSEDSYQSKLDAKVEEINKKLDEIYGYTEYDETTGTSSYVNGYMDTLDGYVSDLNGEIDNLYNYLSMLYDIYNNEYKLATILTEEINYLTIEEYEEYLKGLLGTTDEVKSIYKEEADRLMKLYDEEALSNVEKSFLTTVLGISFAVTEEDENPVQKYFDELFKNTAADRVYWANKIKEIREVGIFAEMANYCLIKRMEEPNVGSAYCFMQDYLKERIKVFSLEGINVDYERELLELLNDDEVSIDRTDSSRNETNTLEKYGYPNLTWTTADLLENLFDYATTVYSYTNDTVSPAETINIPTCVGEYEEIFKVITKVENFANLAEIAERAKVDLADTEVNYVYNNIKNKNFVKFINYNETIIEENFKGDLNLYNDLVALASKFATNSDEVSRYITLAKLRKLDVSYNAELSDFARISELTGLRELDANASYITNLSEVDWSAMTYLTRLGLAYNYISDIKPLETLKYIKELDVSHNLIGGELKFNFTNVQKTLKEFDLSYNQITDITDILKYLDMKSGGNDGNYLSREDTININLNNQNIELTVEDPIYLDQYPNTVNINLPKIFTQLLAIDVNRTSFGETSQNGRVESEGRYVTLNTLTAGDKEGVVEVIAMNGNGSAVDTCVGEGTKATIKYTVVARTVSNITITEKVDVMKLGETAMFKAEVEGENIDNTSVIWEIAGNESEETKVEVDGTVTIAADETAKKVTVTAKSAFDLTKEDSVEVLIDENNPVEVTMELTPETVDVKPGSTQEFKATVTAPEGTDTTVVWTVEGNVSENTTISEDGVLTIAADETAETLKVTATSKVDVRVAKTATVNVKAVNAPIIDGVELGYKVEDEYLTTIDPKTPVSAFKSKLLDNDDYKVVIMKDGEEVTSGTVATGMYVQIQDKDGNVVGNGNELYVYQIVVRGDVNGDGVANSLDSIAIKAYRNEVRGYELAGEALEAADINDDGNVNVTDSKLLLYHRAEVKGYSLNYAK